MSEENFTEETTPEPVYEHEYLSNTDAMAGVITSPSDTYETIAASPRKNYWLMPVLITVVVSLITSFLFMQDKELVSDTMEEQRAKMQEQFDKNIKEGKMSQEDAEKMMESVNQDSPFFKLIGYGGALLGPFIILFILSLVYFIALKIAKSNIDFTNIMNVVGLAMLISAIGNLLSIVISIFKGDMSTIGPSLILSDETVGRKIYTLLMKLDLFSIWFYGVVAIGLSKIGKIGMGTALIIVFGLFVVYALGSSLIF